MWKSYRSRGVAQEQGERIVEVWGNRKERKHGYSVHMAAERGFFLCGSAPIEQDWPSEPRKTGRQCYQFLVLDCGLGL